MSSDSSDVWSGTSFGEAPDGAFGEPDLLRAIVSAYGGLTWLYRSWSAHEDATAEERVLVSLLARDWTERSSGLVARSKGLRGAGEEGESDASVAAEVLTRILGRSGLVSRLEAGFAAAERAAICIRLVPLGYASAEVAALFRACVEAEDLHLARAAWLRRVAVD